ncbi:MAG TPA: sugar transferase [Bryobacteraceae bacterium]|nr:sugar transferase [Bryobacteraceae bacterium]
MATIPVPQQAAPIQDLSWQTIDVCERVVSVVLFTILSPILLVSAAVVSLLSRRVPLIAHRRVGYRGTTLWMLKLRTMWNSEAPGTSRRVVHTSRWVEYIEDVEGPERKKPGDARVTNWFARFCRKHSIDEMPQLWHVIRGEMSLVGPRPVTDVEIQQHYGTDAAEVLQVKPGLAGLWQVSGRNRLSYDERRRLDLRFVRNRSVRMYFRILLRTVPEVWSGSNSW